MEVLVCLSMFCGEQAVLVSVPDLECGFSRDLFVQWATNPKNSVILTCRPSPGCLARDLIDHPKAKSVEIVVRGHPYRSQ